MHQQRCFFPSLTRITDLEHKPFDVELLAREHWEMGDYVQAEVTGVRGQSYVLELNTGRMMETMSGDKLVGAFGERTATLVGVGAWDAIGDDLCMDALTSAGLLGKTTSISPLIPKFMSLRYLGHVTRNGSKLNMRDFVPTVQERKLETPVVLLVGTSMSAGKTTTGRVVIHELKRSGYSVVGAKLTGAGRYRDVLSFSDAGADHIFDFVDAGLPSTVCDPDEYRNRLRQLLSRIASIEADVLVAEAGASPLEPYNGATAIEAIRDNVRCTILCASDPYAVAGVQAAFEFQPDLVSGPAANTDAAISLVKKLTDVRALNLMQPSSTPELAELLREKLSTH